MSFKNSIIGGFTLNQEPKSNSDFVECETCNDTGIVQGEEFDDNTCMDCNAALKEFCATDEDAKPPQEDCETCNGDGFGMTMVCYGDSPVEKNVACPDCDNDFDEDD